MGFGGHLIWTGVFDTLAKSGEKGAAVKVPLLTDIIRGKLYRRDHSYAEDEVFRLNPDVCHVTPVKKNKVEYVLIICSKNSFPKIHSFPMRCLFSN